MKFNLRGERVIEFEPGALAGGDPHFHTVTCPKCKRVLGPEDVSGIDDSLIYLTCVSCKHEWKEPND